jgi:hypothetical protein
MAGVLFPVGVLEIVSLPPCSEQLWVPITAMKWIPVTLPPGVKTTIA